MVNAAGGPGGPQWQQAKGGGTGRLGGAGSTGALRPFTGKLPAAGAQIGQSGQTGAGTKAGKAATIPTQSTNNTRGLPSAKFEPVEVSFDPATAPSVEDMTRKILAFPGNEATPEQARQIAQSVSDASREFDLDPKILLAILGRESKFNPRADDGNGDGLGQLTKPAVDELQRISAGGRDGYRKGVRADTLASLRNNTSRALFNRVETSAGRKTIGDNVRTSAAYARIMMDISSTGSNADVSRMLRRYNGSGGTIEAQYPGKVGDAYRALWGTQMPATIPNAH